MKYTELVSKLTQSDLRNYILRYYRNLYLNAIKVIETVDDDVIDCILNNGDVIKSISVCRDSDEYTCSFHSSFSEEPYSSSVPVNKLSDLDFLDGNIDLCVEIYIGKHTIEFTTHALDQFTEENSNADEELHKALGNALVTADLDDSDPCIEINESFFQTLAEEK